MRAPLMILVVLLCAGCHKGPDVTRGDSERLGPGNWTVDGVMLGSSFDDVEDLLGPGEQRTFADNPVYAFGTSDTSVTFNTDRVATKVSGKRLLRDDENVLRVGDVKESVAMVLGQGYIVERFSPKGGGIITTGSVPLWTENYYHDGANRFHIFVNDDNVIGGIHTASMENLPLP